MLLVTSLIFVSINYFLDIAKVGITFESLEILIPIKILRYKYYSKKCFNFHSIFFKSFLGVNVGIASKFKKIIIIHLLAIILVEHFV